MRQRGAGSGGGKPLAGRRRWAQGRGVQWDFELWFLAGWLGGALLVFALGAGWRWVRPSRPPTLPLGPGLGGWRVRESLYHPLDLAVMAFFVGYYGVFQLLVSGQDEPRREVDLEMLVANALLQGFLVMIVLAVMARRVEPVEWLGLRWRVGSLPGRVALVGAVGIGATVVTSLFAYGLEWLGWFGWLLERLGHGERDEAVQEVVQAFAKADDPWLLGMLCVTAVVVAPVTEEVIFRGYLYPVAKRYAGRGVAVLFSALFFSMIHLNAMALLPLTLLAVGLVLAYEWSGSIWVPIGIHAIFNGVTVFFQLAQKFEWMDLPQS